MAIAAAGAGRRRASAVDAEPAALQIGHSGRPIRVQIDGGRRSAVGTADRSGTIAGQARLAPWIWRFRAAINRSPCDKPFSPCDKLPHWFTPILLKFNSPASAL